MISNMVENGAILEIGGGRILLGYFELVASNRAFYVVANPKEPNHAQVFEFDRFQLLHQLGAEFLDPHGEMIAFLCPIAEAGFGDEEGRYWEAWATWQQCLENPTCEPAAREFITKMKASLLDQPPPDPPARL